MSVMSEPKSSAAHVEIRMTDKGKLQAFWKGERLPCVEISVSATGTDRAAVVLRLAGPQVKLATESGDE
ncbi:hypothetical protein [Pelagibacterium sp. H642]|uniref:hypothetical protein n=1 Tax=Pelagibacterium sp. H642 TaxID=1881069 RepID=UPI00281514B3|nr:hypothetical protein [Pelagibacterium sp. H642]WMT90151.1 hypothetical protein NO934_15335 [Pelagibacterium sp. H642]